MTDSRQTLGEVIADARRGHGLTQKELAALTGYGESGVSIARIEAGVISQPSKAKLEKLAETLELDIALLRRLAVRPSGRRPLAGPRLRRANRDRVEELKRHAEAFAQETERYYQPLEHARRDIETRFLQPLFERTARVSDLPIAELADIKSRGSAGSHASSEEMRHAIDEYRAGVAKALAGQVAMSVGGAAAGGAVGAGAAFATYSAVAAFATASTGTAISTLSGAAAANATMAALGGGSLAAGGLGVAGGTVVLGSIIALPAAAVAGIAFYKAGQRWTQHEDDEAARIKEAEDEFDARTQRISDSFPWVTRAHAFLTLALQRASNRLQRLGENPQASEPDRTVRWADLSNEVRATLQELLDLAAVTISVLPLPVIATPDPTESAEKVATLEQKSHEWNDAVLDQALAWFAT